MTRDIRELPDFRKPSPRVAPADREVLVHQPPSPMRAAMEDQAALGIAAAQQSVVERRAKLEELKAQREYELIQEQIEEAEERRAERLERRARGRDPQQPAHDPMMLTLMDKLASSQQDTQAQMRTMQQQMMQAQVEENARMRELLQRATERPPEKDPVSMLTDMLGVQRQVVEMAKLSAPPPPLPGSGDGPDPGTMIEVMKAQNLHEIEKAKLAMLQQQQQDERQMKLMQIQDQSARTDMFGGMIKQLGTPAVGAGLQQAAKMLGFGGKEEGQTTATAVPQSMTVQCTHCGGMLQVDPNASAAVCPHCAWTVHDQGPPTPPQAQIGAPVQDTNVVEMRPSGLAEPMPPDGEWSTTGSLA